MLSEYLIPTVVILIANLFSDHPGGKRWEFITMLFGLTCLFFLLIFFILLIQPDFLKIVDPCLIQVVEPHLIPVMCCTLLVCLSRDYEKILKSLVNSFMDKK